jgi:hypothetical protein
MTKRARQTFPASAPREDDKAAKTKPPLYLMSLLNIFGVNFLVLRAAACVSYAHAIFIYISRAEYVSK